MRRIYSLLSFLFPSLSPFPSILIPLPPPLISSPPLFSPLLISSTHLPSPPLPYTLLPSIHLPLYSSPQAVLDTLQHLQGQHSWFACTHSRPTYCNVCSEALHGMAWHGLSCEVCKFKSHRRCVFKVNQVCKWTTRSSLQEAGVQLGQDVSQWVGL